MIAQIVDWIRAPIRWALLKGLLILSPRTALNGLEIVDVAEEETEQTIGALSEALQLIDMVDSRRYKRLERDLRRIILMRAGAPEFASEVGACMLRSRYVRENRSAVVATTLVHEATHARLWRSGIRYGPQLRGRVEAVCVGEQIAFAERLGDTEILAYLREKLQRPWWTREQLHERRLAAWRDLGLPEWAIRCFEKATPGRTRAGRPRV